MDGYAFPYVTPPSVEASSEAMSVYCHAMEWTAFSMIKLETLGIPQEDIAMLLPLGMETSVVCKHNLRNIIDMSHQRMCSRAYWEYRKLFGEICDALREYSDEWKVLVDNWFVPKCKYLGRCTEEHPCKNLRGCEKHID
jgi:thymidylate synthase (FAD)